MDCQGYQGKVEGEMEENTKHAQEVSRKVSQVDKDQDMLLKLRMHHEIDADTYADKDMELRDKRSRLTLQYEGAGRQKSEITDLAIKVFELSQTLEDKWLEADIPEKRRILDILCLNLTFKDTSLCVEMRKPFDVLAKGLSEGNGSGDRI